MLLFVGILISFARKLARLRRSGGLGGGQHTARMMSFKNDLYEVGYIFLVPPKGHQVYTLTNTKKEPYIHSPITEI